MADKTLEYLLKLEAGGAIASLRAATDASAMLAAAEKAEAAAARDSAQAQAQAARATADAAEQKRRATIQLENMAVRGDASGAAALSYQRQIAAIRELQAVTGDKDKAYKATIALNREYAATLSSTAGQTHLLTGSSKNLAAGMGNLGAQFADVGVQLAMGMNPLMILIQQGPQIGGAIQQMGGLSSAFAGLAEKATAAAPALTAVGVVLGAVGLVYMEITGIIGDYTAATDAAKAANESFTAALRPLNEALESARDRQAVLRGALGSNDPKAYLAIADISAQADKKQADATKELREERDLLLTQYGLIDNEGSTLAIQTMNRVKEIEKEIAVVHDQADAWASAATVNYTLQAAIDKTTEARERSTAAIVKEDAALKAFMDDVERSRMSGAVAGLERSDTFARLGQQAAALEEVRAKKAREDWIGIAIAMGAQLEESGKEAVDKVRAGLFSSGNGASWMTAISSPEGMLSKASEAGPVGNWIVMIVKAVENLDNTLDKMTDIANNVTNQIGKLPETLSKKLGGALDVGRKIIDMIPTFVQSLADNLGDLIGQIFEEIPKLIGAWYKMLLSDLPTALWNLIKAFFSPAMWVDAFKALAQGFADAFRDVFRSIVYGPEGNGPIAKVGGFLGDAILGKERQGVLHDIWRGPQGQGGVAGAWRGLVGSFDSGGYIPRTGLAMVHRGEYVSTSAETSRGQRRTSDASGGGVTNVNIGPVYGGREAARQIADLLREHMGSNGQRLTIQGA